MITSDGLQDFIKGTLRDRLLVVVSNREPFVHSYSKGNIHCAMPVSGLTAAIDPVMRACGGTWVAHGSGDADRAVVDSNDKVMVPPEHPSYALRRVWLSEAQLVGYYDGFANEVLWPLCHIAYVRPVFDEEHWLAYKAVNEIFADAVCSEIRNDKAIVFIQDYHLALLPRLIKNRMPHVITAQFWHIPWPNPEVFRICPWQEEVLDGLLGNDLLGFHTRPQRNNFLDSVDLAMEANVDREHYAVTRRGQKTSVGFFPISIDFQRMNEDAQQSDVEEEMRLIGRTLSVDGQIIGLGLDRFDYTKGITERLRALDRFIARYPEYRGRVVFIQVGTQSRTQIRAYQQFSDEMEGLVQEINGRWAYGNWEPILRLYDVSPAGLLALRRMAHFSIVSSLHDGMNLVAKEYVASRFDEAGVLILSPFTGAAHELTDALLVNPYATDQFAEAIKTAIEMPKEEQGKRMKRMRQVVEENNVYKWATDIISEIAKV